MNAALRSSERGTDFYLNILGKYFIQWFLILAVIVLGLANPNFRRPANLQNILLQASFAGIGAAGMTMLIISGAFDLSVAGMLGLCGVAVAQFLPEFGILPAVILALALGIVLGLINGLVVTKAKIPAFIATLGTMNVFLAIAFIWTDAQVISVLNKSFRFLGTGTVLGLPVPFLVMIVVYLLAYGILRFTTYGRYIRAVGSNEIASHIAGLPLDRVRVFGFVLVGLCTAIAAVLLTAMLSSANAIMATGYELRVIAVVVVGGTSLFGGKGTLFGSFTGALFFSVINNALNMFGVGAYWQYVAVGLVLITALAIEALRGRFLGVAQS